MQDRGNLFIIIKEMFGLQYKIVWSKEPIKTECIKALERKVQEYLNDGWMLQGGVSIATEMHGYEVSYNACQAIVK